METNQLIQIEKHFTEKQFIKFLINEGITVKTNTKARGNLGICFKNRIDVSKKAAPERRLAILAHEYAHKIHSDIEKNLTKNGGSLEKIFDTQEITDIQKELFAVTNFVDENSKFSKFHLRKQEIDREIKFFEKLIKFDYPDFKRSQEFKPINSYFRKNKSDARYLLKYDRVRIVQPIFRKEKIYSIETLDNDFPQIPPSLRAYIKYTSLKREYNRLYRRKNKADRYYKRPTELFARFIEGLFINKDKIKELAPITYKRFFSLVQQEYYGNLKSLLIQAQLFRLDLKQELLTFQSERLYTDAEISFAEEIIDI